MKITPNLKYLLKVWSLTLVLSPLLLLVFWGFHRVREAEDILQSFIPVYFLFLIYGSYLSLPALCLLGLLCWRFKDWSFTNSSNKIIFSCIAIACTWASFLLIDPYFFSDRDMEVFIWPGTYSLSILVCAFLIKVQKPAAE